MRLLSHIHFSVYRPLEITMETRSKALILVSTYNGENWIHRNYTGFNPRTDFNEATSFERKHEEHNFQSIRRTRIATHC